VDLSVIIVSHDEPELVGPCLDHVESALALATSVVDHEIVIIANLPGSVPDSVLGIDREIDRVGVRVVHNERPLGFATNVNRAMETTSGQHRLLLNPDVAMSARALDALVDVLRSHPTVAAAGPRQVDSSGSTIPSARRFPTVPVIVYRSLRLERWFRPPTFYRRSIEIPGSGLVDWVNGACMLIAAHAWAEIGPFHEGYRIYYEDIDWCDRAARRGWQVWFTADVTVIHDARRSSARWPPNRRTLAHASSIVRYIGRRSVGRLDP